MTHLTDRFSLVFRIPYLIELMLVYMYTIATIQNLFTLYLPCTQYCADLPDVLKHPSFLNATSFGGSASWT